VQENRKKQLPLLATSHGVNHVYQLLVPVIAPELIGEFGESSAGLFVWCFLLSYSLLPAVSGYLTQRFGRRKLLAIGFTMSAACFVAISLTDNIVILALLFFVAGAAGSTYHPSGFPILAEAYSDNRGRTLGLHQAGGAIGSIIGPVLTGLMVAGFAWRSTMMLIAIPGLVLSAVLWFSIDDQPTLVDPVAKPSSKINLKYLRVYSSVVLFLLASFFYVFGQRGTDAFANVYFTYGRGLQIVEASFLFSALKVAGLFSAPVCGKLSDSYGRKKILVALVVLESVSLYAITALPAAILVLPCVTFGFASFGLLTVGEALLADIAPDKQRGAIFGLSLTINFAPYIFLPPILFAMSSVYGFSLGFIILSGLMLVSIPLILKIGNRSSRISADLVS
jgi:MFS family permease